MKRSRQNERLPASVSRATAAIAASESAAASEETEASLKGGVCRTEYKLRGDGEGTEDAAEHNEKERGEGTKARRLRERLG